MKRFDLLRVVGASVLTLGLLVLPEALPAAAQQQTANPTETIPAANPTTPSGANEGDRDFNWSWLGLIGLAGLAGLAPKGSRPGVERDPNA